MTDLIDKKNDVCWFVGASYGGNNDQSQIFIDQGIWINGYIDRYLDAVKSIQPGERIAIKAAYTRKHDLPFDNRGLTVSVMGIKAIGIVKENLGDGRNLKVDWKKLDNPREWYFYTSRLTVWRVLPGDWYTDALIGFTFNNQSQDVDRFRNEPYWRERFGDKPEKDLRFRWTKFYEEMATKLLSFQNDRSELIKGIHEIGKRVDYLSILQDQFSDGTTGPLKDICPFTVMGIFNRGITDSNRKILAAGLAKLLGVEVPVPDLFEGIPILNNQRSWFFNYEKDRQVNDVNVLWKIFAEALQYVDSEDLDSQSQFVNAYNDATKVMGVGWNLTMGLYWIRPWNFPTLDSQSREYIIKKLGIQIGLNGPKGRCNATDYLAVSDILETRFEEETYPVHSFPDLSYAAWKYDDSTVNVVQGKIGSDEEEIGDTDAEIEIVGAPITPYLISDILLDGCFYQQNEIEDLLDGLRNKRNLILQGPPGTGKTWLAKRLAYALIGKKSENRVRSVQFHANLSYEDFVRGWRPTGDGKLTLVDGPFMEMVNLASQDSKTKYVIVIEEINRGNPAQIFGEMLTLLEADKRTPNEALELCYRKKDGEKIYIPLNLYVIGTMNTADRSIALVDFALRRRFAFKDLEPKFGTIWQNWVHDKFGVEIDFLVNVEMKLKSLNEKIKGDQNLGRHFCIGHSYFVPPLGSNISDQKKWFLQVVETDILPLLSEYWYDSPGKIQESKNLLIEGLV
jgi:5-methylcytosine-specific restriction protein B